MYHFDIPKTRQYDTGKIEVIARNSVGEAMARCELKVVGRSDDYRNVLKNSPRPWYDYDLVPYQKERIETELEKTFEEREKYLKEKGIEIRTDHLKPKDFKGTETEWQQLVKEKKNSEYYNNKIAEIESEQIVKEQRNRDQSHQYAIPGEKILKATQAKDMAAKYQQSL